MTKITPLVDTNSLLAIESLFGYRAPDPWAIALAVDFADLFIYADSFRFTIGCPEGGFFDEHWLSAPAIVQQLRKRDSQAVMPLALSTAEPAKLHDDYLDESFRKFAVWSRNNQESLRKWLATHAVPSIRGMQAAQVAREYYFNLDLLAHDPSLERVGGELDVGQAEILYAFDNLLRGPLYGKLTGEDQHYLNHPLRDVSLLPTYASEPGPRIPVTVSFRKTVANMVRRLSFDEYCVLLHELRGIVRGRGIHELPPGQVDRGILRDIAGQLELSPRLRGRAKAVVISGAVIGGLAAVPTLGPISALAGAAVSVSSAIWAGQLPRSASRIKWLRWAYEWDIEEEAEASQAK